jgi:two-component system OmpR family response regulator
MSRKTREEKPFTTGDIARYCYVTQVGVLKWIKSGKLKAYSTPGGHYRILQRDFKHFLEHYEMPIDERFFTDSVKKILVVDDDSTEVEMIIQTLTQDNTNYRFASARDGYEAGLQIAAFQPDLVILDIKTPQPDGSEMCRQIKSHPSTQHISILGLTGITENGTAKRILTGGADAYLSKPLDPDLLKTEVRKLVGFTKRKEDIFEHFQRSTGNGEGT